MIKTNVEKVRDLSNKLESTGADYSTKKLRDIFKNAGLNSQEVERAVAEYCRYREAELSPYLENLAGAEITKVGVDSIVEAILNSKSGDEIVDDILRGYSRYIQQKSIIIETYTQKKSWEEVVASEGFNSDMGDSMEALVDYIEETYQTKVKDAKHLGKLTGLKDEDFKKELNIKPGREITLDGVIINARFNKYFRKLQNSIREGVKYKDLLQIKPEDYGLPTNWENSRVIGDSSLVDHYSAILWAISFEYLISEGNGFLMYTPSLRLIAKEIDAPYSVLMDCYNLTNKGKKYGATTN